jgi:hypothetical protein
MKKRTPSTTSALPAHQTRDDGAPIAHPSRASSAVPTRRTRRIGGIELPRTDGRLRASRRFEKAIRAIVDEIGDTDCLSAAERNLIVNAAALTLASENMSLRIAAGEVVSNNSADMLIRFASETRRIIGQLRQIAAARTATEREEARKAAWRERMEEMNNGH